MLEILSTIGLTVSASLVIGFLAYSMAETPRGRLMVASALAAWFVLVLAIGAGGALDPIRGFGVPALGLTVALPVVALVGAFFASGSIRTAMLATPLSALVAVEYDPNSRRDLCASPCSGQTAGAVRAERRLGRHFHRRHGAAARLGGYAIRPPRATARFCLERRGDRRPRQRHRARRPIGPRSASGLRRPADERHHDHPALAHHSRIPRAEPDVHSRGHFLSAGERRSHGRGASLARRRRGKADVKGVRCRRSCSSELTDQ